MYKTKLDYRVVVESITPDEIDKLYILEEKRKILGITYWWTIDVSFELKEILKSYNKKRNG